MRIEEFRLYPLPFAFVTGGFTSSYGTRTHLNNLLLVLVTDSGLVGLGEICRRPGNSPEPTSAAFAGHCQKFLQNIVGSDSLDLQSVKSKLGYLTIEGTVQDSDRSNRAAKWSACGRG